MMSRVTKGFVTKPLMPLLTAFSSAVSVTSALTARMVGFLPLAAYSGMARMALEAWNPSSNGLQFGYHELLHSKSGVGRLNRLSEVKMVREVLVEIF